MISYMWNLFLKSYVIDTANRLVVARGRGWRKWMKEVKNKYN